MPHFDFYINDAEREEIVKYILSKKTEIIIDKLYDCKKYETINNKSELILNLNKKHVRYFLVDSSFKIEDLDFLEIDFDEGIKFKISQRVGGPYIDLVFYLGHSDDETLKYKNSNVDFYARFIHNNNSYEEFKASEEVKLYYKDLVKFIKSICISKKINNKTFWIGKQVINELNQSPF